MILVVHYTKLAVVDAHGGSWTGVINEEYDEVHVGLMDADGHPIDFESQAYHLKAWCKSNGLHYVEQECTDEIEVED